MGKKSEIKRPTESIALGRWQKSGLGTRPFLFEWQENHERIRSLKRLSGQFVIMFPLVFAQELDDLFWEDVCCDCNSDFVIKTAPNEQMQELIKVLPQKSFKIWTMC